MTLEDAKEAVAHSVIDVALIDYHLDDALGIDIVAVLRACGNIECALITADRGEEMKKQAKELGATVLHKPLKPAVLRSWITRLEPLPPSA